MSKQPYLSIVAATRNDNHGGDLLKRTTCFVNGIYHQAKKFNLQLELIIVEWNPPKGKPLLKDVLPKPIEGSLVTLKYVVVPPEIHTQFKNGKVLPLHQMIAKNVGIRRASGEYVLCTNIDILFSDGCFKEIAKKELKNNHFYRASRFDVPKEIMNIDNLDEQLIFAKKNTLQRMGLRGDFQCVNSFPSFFFSYPNVLYFLDRILSFFLFFYKNKKRTINILNLDACGDFTIMSKKDWDRIYGYYELELFPLHVDSLALIEAYAIGMNQQTFNTESSIYHIYHDGGWVSNYKEPEDLILLMSKRPAIDWQGVYQSGKKLIQQKRIYNFKNDNWGLNNEELTEFSFNTIS